MRAFNIDWETDGEDVDLPTEVEIPSYIKEDKIADYLSDQTGWLVNSLEIEDYEARQMKDLHLQVDFRICYDSKTETIYEMTYNKEKYSLRVLHDGKFHNKIYECDKEIPEELTFFVDTIINRETYKQVGTK